MQPAGLKKWKIWQKKETLDPNLNIKAFIFKISINVIYDFIRHKHIQHAFEDFSRHGQAIENNTWQTVIYDDMKDKILRLAQKLPEQQHRIFQLNKFEGMSNDEIAIKLNLSKRTVENHLYRAIQFLKKHLEEESLLAMLLFYLL